MLLEMDSKFEEVRITEVSNLRGTGHGCGLLASCFATLLKCYMVAGRELSRLCGCPMKTRQILTVRYSPDKSLLVAIGAWAFVVVFNFLAFAQKSMIDTIIFYDVGLLFFAGVLIPVFYTRYSRRAALREIGLARAKWKLSSLIGLIATAVFVAPALMGANLSGLGRPDVFVPLLILILVSGFFEAVFFRGFIQLTFERGFGIIPGILIGSIMYSLYHIGYPGWATVQNILSLFLVGMVYAVVFRTTSEILNQWPIFIPAGALLDIYVKHGTIVQWPEAYGCLAIGLAYLVLFVYVFRRGRDHS